MEDDVKDMVLSKGIKRAKEDKRNYETWDNIIKPLLLSSFLWFVLNL